MKIEAKKDDKGDGTTPAISLNPVLSVVYLMAGKYHYCRGGSSETIEKDTLIEEQTDLGEYVAVRLKGFDFGSFAVFDRKKIK